MEIKRVLPLLKDGWREKSGRAFFIEPPQNIEPETLGDEERTDASKWSVWRTDNYAYLEKNLTNLPNDAVIIDLGAGQVSYKKLVERFPNFIGVDFYPYEPVGIICDFTKELPIKDGVADVVILSNVLEHVPTPELLLKESARILKPNGRLIGAVPFIIKLHQEPHDFLRYTRHMLEFLLRNTGFRKFEITALGNTAELYTFTQNHLFKQLRKESKNTLERILTSIARLLSNLTTKLFWPLYKKAAPSEIYPAGYGFTAYK